MEISSLKAYIHPDIDLMPAFYLFGCLFIHFFFLAVLVLCCCMGFSLVVESRGYSLLVVSGLLIEVASLVVELGSVGFSTCGMWAQQLRLQGSGAQA